MEKFEKASKLKLRFNTPRGMITSEDLWDLPLSEIDTLARECNEAVQVSGGESFVVKKSKPSEVVELRFDIVKQVIKVRLEEIEATKVLAANKIKRDRILDIIDEQEDDALKDLSPKELKKMAKKLV